jgi:hypothetical protein
MRIKIYIEDMNINDFISACHNIKNAFDKVFDSDFQIVIKNKEQTYLILQDN